MDNNGCLFYIEKMDLSMRHCDTWINHWTEMESGLGFTTKK